VHRTACSLQSTRVLLYYITDRKGFPGSESEQRAALLRRIAEVARAGVDYIQLREKDLAPGELEQLARDALCAVRENSAVTRLLINTHSEVALSIGADGVHLPAGSPLPSAMKARWPESGEPVVGVSARSVEDVIKAQSNGATFAVLAPIFEKSATGADGIGLDVVHEACTQSSLPVLALGGVSLDNARACLDAGASGIAGIRLFQEGNLAGTVKRLRELATLRAPLKRLN
jgi:thiamine-phosphate pyrophosphorylase